MNYISSNTHVVMSQLQTYKHLILMHFAVTCTYDLKMAHTQKNKTYFFTSSSATHLHYFDFWLDPALITMQTIGVKHAGELTGSYKDELTILFTSLKKSLTLREVNCSSTVSDLVLHFLAHYSTLKKSIMT